jgi:hypothetical protein
MATTGNRSAVLLGQALATPPVKRCSIRARPAEQLAQRNPMLLLRLPGSFLLRMVTRALFRLLFQPPPRSTETTCPHSQAITSPDLPLG